MRRVLPAVLFAFVVIGPFSVPTSVFAACNIVGGKAYGDCAGVSVTQGAKPRLTVRSYVSESSLIDGATILKGGSLDLSGISNGDIIVHSGARLRLTGIVNGTVKNLGGNVEIEGSLDRLHTIGGDVVIGGNVDRVSGDGSVSYKKGAVIGGVPIEKTIRKGGKVMTPNHR